MNKVISDIRLFLFTCSGEDNYILKRCNWGIQKRFALIGFSVVLIFIGCFFSALCFTYNLFEGARWVSIPIGLIWGTMVVNLYLLLLHTISPPIVPLASKKKKNKTDSENHNKFLTLSMTLRLGFMMLLAIIIAQPLNVAILSSSVSESIEKHKVEERIKLYILTNKYLIDQELQNQKDFNKKISLLLNNNSNNITLNHLQITDKINRDKQFILTSTKKLKQLSEIDCHIFLTKKQKQIKTGIIDDLGTLLNDELLSNEIFINGLKTNPFKGMLKNEYDHFRSSLGLLMIKKANNYNALNQLLQKSNFYVKTIQLLLLESPMSWLITIIVCLIFLVPIYLKYEARNISAKIFKSKEYEQDIVRLREELINTTDFNWLEKKIKSTNIREIRTPDYYFQRMLIEHKIILEEYDQTKRNFSKILTDNIKKYNSDSLKRLLPLLEKLKKVNLFKYNELSAQIIAEYKDQIIIKYEYWLDTPFRTKRFQTIVITNNEVGLLDFVYAKVEEEENENDEVTG